MSSREFAEWTVFAGTEPIGEAREDLRTAMLCALIANVNRDEKTKPYEPADFLIDFWKDESESQQTWEDQLKLVEMLNTAFGGQDLRKH